MDTKKYKIKNFLYPMDIKKYRVKNFLCLDLGTKTGWALGRNNGDYVGNDVATFKNDRYSGGGMRFVRFMEWLGTIHKTFPLDAIYFEEVRNHKGTDAAHVYGGFLAILSSWCEENKVPYEGIPVQTIKKAITGKGNAKKWEVIEAVFDKMNINSKDHNEADALALMYYITQKNNTSSFKQGTDNEKDFTKGDQPYSKI